MENVRAETDLHLRRVVTASAVRFVVTSQYRLNHTEAEGVFDSARIPPDTCICNTELLAGSRFARIGVTCRVTLVHPEMGETLREVALWGICFLLLLGFFPGAKRLGGGSGQMQHIMAVLHRFAQFGQGSRTAKKSGTSLPFCYSSAMGSFLSGQRQALESDESSESESSGCWRTVPQVFVLQFQRWKS